MTNLKSILIKYSDSGRNLGDISEKVGSTDDKNDDLRRELDGSRFKMKFDSDKPKKESTTSIKIDELNIELHNLSLKNSKFFWMCVVMVLAVFVAEFVLTFFNFVTPGNMQVIITASGVSVGGLIAYMNKLWKEKVNTDLIITLASTLDKETVNSVLVALINKL